MHIDNDIDYALADDTRNLSVTEQGILFFRRNDRDGRGLSSCFIGRDLDVLAEAVREAQAQAAQWRASENA